MYSFVAYRASITLWWQSTHLQVFEVLSWGWYTRLGMWEGILILENFSRTLWSKIYLVKKLVPRGYIDMTKMAVFSNRSHHAPMLSVCLGIVIYICCCSWKMSWLFVFSVSMEPWVSSVTTSYFSRTSYFESLQARTWAWFGDTCVCWPLRSRVV
jgi:hypothetical protein